MKPRRINEAAPIQVPAPHHKAGLGMGILTLVIGGSARRTRSFPRAGRWLPAGAVMTGLVLVGGAVPANAQTLTWSVVHSPNRRAGGNSLVAVSCVSAHACMAVGFTQGGPGGTLAESWDGTRWSVVPTPSLGGTGSDLTGVSCVAANACTAVGGVSPNGTALSTVIESWDGTRWSVVPSPNPATGGGFSGVSCASADACMAVGFSGSESGFHGTLAESWNGTRWSVLPTPSPGTNGNFLNGVSCVSPDTCTAAGEAFH